MSSLAGRVFGDYQLETQIGSGVIGTVFRARHLGRGDMVALKIVHPNLAADPGFPDRFRRIAGPIARLRHPNVVAVTELGEVNAQFFIVMELLTSGSLRTLLEHREEQLPLPRGIEYVRQGADALAAAHGMGIVHRDVKPENLLLVRTSGAGTMKMVDFGLTALMETSVTVIGGVMPGSPKYMSPEQGRGAQLDARSDIYSLGVVLYEVATGYPPFQVQTFAEAAAKHMGATPAAPRSVNSKVPPALEAIILRCLAKRPEDRYHSASELSEALAGALGNIQPIREEKIRWQDDRPASPPTAVGGGGGGGGKKIIWRDDQQAAAQPPPPPPESGQRRFRVQLRDDGGSGGGRGETQTPSAAPPPPPPPQRPPVDRQRIKVRHDTPAGPTLPISVARGAAHEKPGEPVRGPGGELQESKRIKFMIDRPSLVVSCGQPAILRATLMNGGRIVDHYPLTVEGIPPSWVQMPAAPPQLNPGERTTVAMTVNVPRIPDSHAGVYTVTIRAQALKNPNEFATAKLELTVQPFTNSALTLEPSRARGWRRASYGIRLKNDGNATTRFALAGLDDEHMLRYRFGDPHVTLGPGDAASMRLHVQSRLRWVGSTEARAFTVQAEPISGPDGAPAPAQTTPISPAQYMHRALVPLWVPPLLILGALALWMYLKSLGGIVVAVAPPALIMGINSTARVVATVSNKKNEQLPNQVVKWSIADTNIATVDDSGNVRGKKIGSTLISAKRDRTSASAQVQVVLASVDKLIVRPPSVVLKIGQTANFASTATDASGNTLKRDATWQSSDPTVAAVGGNGRVVAKDSGLATITAMVEGKVATAEVTVKATPPVVVAGGNGDCVSYDPGTLKVMKQEGAGFAVTDGSKSLLLLDNETDAQRALSVAQRYKTHCFLGRSNKRPDRNRFIIEYWNTFSGATTVVDNEECFPYQKSSLKSVDQGANGWVLADTTHRLLLADSKEDAQLAWDVAIKHSALCFIGRGNPRANQRDYIVQYWK